MKPPAAGVQLNITEPVECLKNVCSFELSSVTGSPGFAPEDFQRWFNFKNSELNSEIASSYSGHSFAYFQWDASVKNAEVLSRIVWPGFSPRKPTEIFKCINIQKVRISK